MFPRGSRKDNALSQWIDYWAIDWNYRAIHSTTNGKLPDQERTEDRPDGPKYRGKARQIYRSRKVIDILGNETTKAVEVEL